MALVPELVADINPVIPGASSNPGLLAATRDRFFFFATDGGLNTSMWSSDGTSAGTVPALPPGVRVIPSSSPPPQWSASDTHFFMRHILPSQKLELWAMGGTAESFTKLGAFPQIYDMTAVGGRMYFGGDTSPDNIEPWVSDGTLDGTHLVKKMTAAFFNSAPRYFVEMNGLVYFAARGSDDPSQPAHRSLFVTDDTPSGTRVVAVNDSTPELNPRYIVRVGSRLFFNGSDATGGSELWVSDGTQEGTRRAIDLLPGTDSSDPRELVSANGLVFFTALGTDGSRKLWRSDGTAEGTQLMGQSLTIAGTSANSLFYVAPGNVLMATDGSLQGTHTVFDFDDSISVGRFASLGGGIAFVADSTSRQFYWTDGEPGAIQQLADLPMDLSIPGSFVVLRNTVYLAHRDDEHGTELWKLSPPPGDTNFDGEVNIADLNNVRNNFGATGNVLGDTDGDNDVDITDLNAVRNNFGAGSPSPALSRHAARVESVETARVDAEVSALALTPSPSRNWQDALFRSQAETMLSAESTGFSVDSRRLKAVDRWFARL